jgi:ATP-binding protein involved in chromosome partitioning
MVGTPQDVAVIDVVKAIDFFQKEKIEVPILGLIENMAWFTPEELPNNKYYIFGKEGCANLAKEMGIPLLGEIPLVQAIAESGDSGKPTALWSENPTPESEAFMRVAENAIKEICKLKTT